MECSHVANWNIIYMLVILCGPLFLGSFSKVDAFLFFYLAQLLVTPSTLRLFVAS